MDGSRSEDGLMARVKLVRWKEQGLREEVWLASEGSLTFKSPFESAVSVWLDQVGLPTKPFSPPQFITSGAVIFISLVGEADTDMKKYFAFQYYAKHSLHTDTDSLSAHLSWTLNHFPGIHWNNFSVHYKVCFRVSVS